VPGFFFGRLTLSLFIPPLCPYLFPHSVPIYFPTLSLFIRQGLTRPAVAPLSRPATPRAGFHVLTPCPRRRGPVGLNIAPLSPGPWPVCRYPRPVIRGPWPAMPGPWPVCRGPCAGGRGRPPVGRGRPCVGRGAWSTAEAVGRGPECRRPFHAGNGHGPRFARRAPGRWSRGGFSPISGK